MKWNKLVFAVLAVLAAWGIAPGQQDGQKVDIRLTFQPGRYEFIQEVSVYDERTLGQTTIGQRIDTVQTSYLKILGVQSDGRIGMMADLSKAGHVVSTGPMGVPEWDIVLKYDSADPEKQDPALAEIFKNLLNKKITFNVPPVRPAGDSAMVNFTPLIDVFNRQASGRETAESLVGGFQQNLSEAIVWQPAGLLPDGPVSVGQQWKGRWVVAMPGLKDIEVPLDCNLASVSGQGERLRAVVEFSGKFASLAEKSIAIEAAQPAKPAASQPALAIKIDKVSVEVKGSAKFNIAAGIISCLEAEQLVTLDETLTGADGKTAPAQISSKANVKYTAIEQDSSEYNPLDEPPKSAAQSRPATAAAGSESGR